MTSEAETNRSRPVKAVLNAIDVLDVVAEARDAVGVSAIARRVGLSKATVHAILTTLEMRSMVRQVSASSEYKLDWRLYELGQTLVNGVDLAEVVRGQLTEVAAVTGETALVGIWSSDAAVFIEGADSPHPIRLVARVGRRAPLHATATGKLLLAAQPESRLTSLLRGPLERYTEHTITEPDALREDLETVRVRGYARCAEEHQDGVCGVSVPLRNHASEVVAALSLAGPAHRFGKDATEQLVERISDAAEDISRRLGKSDQG